MVRLLVREGGGLGRADSQLIFYLNWKWSVRLSVLKSSGTRTLKEGGDLSYMSF